MNKAFFYCSYIFPVILLLLTGCAGIEELPPATAAQTAEIFDRVISDKNRDVVMCRRVKTTYRTATMHGTIILDDWYDVIYSVKNYLRTGDKLVITQIIDAPAENYIPVGGKYVDEVVYIDMDISYGKFVKNISPFEDQFIFFMEGPHGDLLNPVRIGQKYDYTKNALNAFFQVKKNYWKKLDPNWDIHWFQGPRQIPTGKSHKH